VPSNDVISLAALNVLPLTGAGMPVDAILPPLLLTRPSAS
jgi:hypothetical protein